MLVDIIYHILNTTLSYINLLVTIVLSHIYPIYLLLYRFYKWIRLFICAHSLSDDSITMFVCVQRFCSSWKLYKNILIAYVRLVQIILPNLYRYIYKWIYGRRMALRWCWWWWRGASLLHAWWLRDTGNDARRRALLRRVDVCCSKVFVYV